MYKVKISLWHINDKISTYYYMASVASGQDDPNRALWLATRASKMERRLGTTRCIPKANLPRKPYNESFIDQVNSVKMAGYCPRPFFASLWTSTSSRKKKKELGQYPAILTSHLVNNSYTLRCYCLPERTSSRLRSVSCNKSFPEAKQCIKIF